MFIFLKAPNSFLEALLVAVRLSTTWFWVQPGMADRPLTVRLTQEHTGILGSLVSVIVSTDRDKRRLLH